LANEDGEANHSVLECCLLIVKHGNELDYKYEQLVSYMLTVASRTLFESLFLDAFVTYSSQEAQESRRTADDDFEQVLDNSTRTRKHEQGKRKYSHGTGASSEISVLWCSG
jgi:hypothetical protein